MDNTKVVGTITKKRKIAGVLCIAIGVVFCFIPVGQGILTIVIGLVLLGNETAIRFCKKLAYRILGTRRAERLKSRILQRLPHLRRKRESAENTSDL